MALPIDVKTLKYSADGSPWCKVVAKSSINPDTLKYSLDGSPWWGMYGINMTSDEFIPQIIWLSVFP